MGARTASEGRRTLLRDSAVAACVEFNPERIRQEGGGSQVLACDRRGQPRVAPDAKPDTRARG